MLLHRISCLLLLLSFVFASALHSEELHTWPRELAVSSGTITVYQPQVESLEENILKGRAAMAYHRTGSDTPVFGVVWFTARVHIDRSQNRVHYETLTITNTRLPEGNRKIGEEFKDGVEMAMNSANLTSSLDAITTSLAAVGQEQKQAADLKNSPPRIIYMEKPALLLAIDGNVSLQRVENSTYQYVANTPYPLFTDGKNWYLNVAEKVWYRAADVDGPWRYDSAPPTDLEKMVAAKVQKYDEKSPASEGMITAANAPLIAVSHTPAELIVSVGKASFQPLTDDLLVMNNSESDVFMDLRSQHYFLVISGRWYLASSMRGKWDYVASDQLPVTFKDIPKDSKYAYIRSYVAGTDEAKEAVMDAQIPQTAAVKRGVVDIDVVYDGRPNFEQIVGTNLSFALNCTETVIAAAGGDFYLVKDAVWYLGGSATGPWLVADHAPPGIDQVPPSSPVYNTKYVYVYDSSPDVVYVGYTPGYVGSYIYGPTIVYGTGWYYHPWVSPQVYYPRPATWGLSVSYNPWSGWGFGMSWSSGPFTLGFYTGGGYHGHHWGRGWYGPRGYRGSYNHVNINTVNIHSHNRFSSISRGNNLYRNVDQRAHITSSINARTIRTGGRRDMGAGVRSGQAVTRGEYQRRKNNILADHNGNVFRHSNGQWQQHSGGQWQGHGTSLGGGNVRRSSSRGFSGYSHPSSMDRHNYSRQRTVERSYQSRGRSGGGSFRRGGGRGHR